MNDSILSGRHGAGHVAPISGTRTARLLLLAAAFGATLAATPAAQGATDTTLEAPPAPLRLSQIEQRPLPTLQQPVLSDQLRPRRMAPKRAMVIVVEENKSVNFSVSWYGLGRGVTSFEYQQLLPSNIRPVVAPVVDVSVQLASALGLPAAALADEISASLGRQVAGMLGQHISALAAQAGLPAGGCARQMFSTLADAGVRTGKNPFSAFADVYGETAMGNCLKAMAEPYYDTVVVLSDNAAKFDAFSEQLLSLHKSNHVIDVLINLHGCGQKSGKYSELNNVNCDTRRLVFADGGASASAIAGIKAGNGGQPLNLNAVYQVSCWGSEFNEAWTTLGAKAVNGARELNYYVLLSPFVFMDRFTRGNRTLQQAAQDAYTVERSLLNGRPFTARLDLRSFLNRTFPPPRVGFDLVAQACPGGTRNGCDWSFAPPYSTAVNLTLSKVRYGHDKTRPVNHAASSARRHAGPTDLRRALARQDDGDPARLLASY